MAEEININQVSVEDYAAEIGGAASYFKQNPIVLLDEKSTITANGKAKKTYSQAQELIEQFGVNLEKEKNNIRSLGLSFDEYDSMLAVLWDNTRGAMPVSKK